MGRWLCLSKRRGEIGSEETGACRIGKVGIRKGDTVGIREPIWEIGVEGKVEYRY